MELQGHLDMRSDMNKQFLESDQLINLRRYQTDMGLDMVAVFNNNPWSGEGVVAVIKEYTHPSAHFDSWILLLKESRPVGVEAAPGSDRPEERIKWPGQHAILEWEGGQIKRTRTPYLNDQAYAPFTAFS